MIGLALITILGLAASTALVYHTDLRLSGVVVVPLLAIYTLFSAVTLPLFIVSTAVAVAVLAIITSRTLIHGRPLFLLALAAGAIVPLTGTLATTAFSLPLELTFMGTILPGVAAYNYHRLDADTRFTDVAASGAVFVGLIFVGTVFAMSPLGGATLTAAGVKAPVEAVTVATTAADVSPSPGGAE